MEGISIVAHFAFGSINGGHSGHFGGVERHTSFMARWLAARGHQVSLLTWDEGQDDEVKIDGVRVIKMCRSDAGLPGLRFFHPRWSSLNAALKRADAALYYHNCAEYVTGQVALWCRQNGRKFVYSSASDPECDPALPDMPKVKDRLFYRYGIRHADRIIVQTNKQRHMLRQGFCLGAIVLPMPCAGATADECPAAAPPRGGSRRVLWVGRIAEVKRLEVLLDLAAALPDVTFEIAGKPDCENAYSQAILARARSLPNVIVHGSVPRDRMSELYGRAALLCCTSAFEGFPNTFLEAWSYGVPVVSTIDPDDLIASRGLGMAAPDKENLFKGIATLLNSPDLWRTQSHNARQYYVENHAPDAAMLRFEQLFLRVMRGQSAVMDEVQA